MKQARIVVRLILAFLLVASSALARGGGSWASWARRPWIPRDVPNMAAIYYGDQGTTIVTGVSSWADQSLVGASLLQATTTKQPALTAGALNGLACLTADGIDDFIRTTSLTLGLTKTIFVVGKWNTAFSAQSSLFDGSNGNAGRLYRSASTTVFIVDGSGTQFSSTGATPTSYHYHTAIFNGASSIYRQDGVQLGTGNTGSATAGGLSIFSFGIGTSDWAAATVCAVVALNRAATAQEVAAIEFFLRVRYAL